MEIHIHGNRVVLVARNGSGNCPRLISGRECKLRDDFGGDIKFKSALVSKLF